MGAGGGAPPVYITAEESQRAPWPPHPRKLHKSVPGNDRSDRLEHASPARRREKVGSSVREGNTRSPQQALFLAVIQQLLTLKHRNKLCLIQPGLINDQSLPSNESQRLNV